MKTISATTGAVALSINLGKIAAQSLTAIRAAITTGRKALHRHTVPLLAVAALLSYLGALTDVNYLYAAAAPFFALGLLGMDADVDNPEDTDTPIE